MSIPRAFIDELIARADVVEIIDSYVSLRKAGKDYQACCPFHQEKTPSFTVSREKQFYYCFGCNAAGNVISFLMEYANLEFVAAVEELASRLGVEVPFTDEPDNDNRQAHKNRLNQLYTLLAEVADFYIQQLQQHPQASTARDYLLQRGLNVAIQTDYKIGFAPPAWNSVLQHFGTSPDNIALLIEAGLLSQNDQGKRYDRFRDRVVFPIIDSRGRVVGFGGRVLEQGEPKYLNSPETPVFHKGQELYGWYRARQQRPAPEQALVVEGYMDVVALAQFDINNAVATLGTATSSEHAQQLFRHVNEVIFCFDGDKAGRKAGWRALETVLPQMQSGRQVRFMFLPDGEDPDSLVRTLGREAFLELLAQAQPLSQFLFAHLSKQTDVRNLDGRARLVELAKPLLQKIPATGAYYGLMLQALSERSGMSLDQLQRYIHIDDKQKIAQKSVPRQKKSPAKQNNQPSPMRTVISLLVQYPDLEKHITAEKIQTILVLAGGDLLYALLEFIRSRPKIKTGGILGHWHDSEHATVLNKLAAWQHPIPTEGLDAEFSDAMHRLFQHAQTQHIDALVHKSRFTTLSEAEKASLKMYLASR